MSDPNPPVFVTAEAGPTEVPGDCPGSGRPALFPPGAGPMCPVCGLPALVDTDNLTPAHELSPKYHSPEGLPVFVTARDRITMLENCLRGLLAHGFRNVTVIDNDSRAPIPAGWWKIVRTDNTHRQLSAWHDPAVAALLPREGYYIVCDGDVAIDGECPVDLGPYLVRLMDAHPDIPKIGLQIRTDDLPLIDRYPETKIGQGTFPEIDEDLTAMPSDTHFAIYRSPAWPGICGARTKAPYLCRHLPWYNRRFSDEEREYYDRVGERWATEHRAAELYQPDVGDVIEMTTAGHVVTDEPVPDSLDDWINNPEPEAGAQALQVAWVLTRDPFMGGEFYRGFRAAALASKHFGWHTLIGRNLASADEQPDGRIWCLTPENPPKAAMAPDVLIVRPVANLDPDLVRQAQRAGQAVIADIDDNVWRHQDYLGRTRSERDETDRYDEWFPLVDAVLASTPQLARFIRDDLKHPAPVFVAPNCFDVLSLSEASSCVPGRVLADRLWLSGRMDADLEMYDEVLPKLLDDLDCVFMHVGAEPGHRFPDRLGWQDVPDWRIIERPTLPIPMFPAAFVGASVGVFFVSEHGFNEAKTLTHAVELAAMMPIVVASDLTIYQGKVPGLCRPEYPYVRDAVERLISPSAWHEERERCLRWATSHAKWAEDRYLRGIYNAIKAVKG